MDFFVGTYARDGGQGISHCRLERDALSVLGTTQAIDNPIWLLWSERFGTLIACGDDPDTGSGLAAMLDVREDGMRLKSRQATGGDVPCHAALSDDEAFLYTANYIGGSVSVLPIRDGALDKRVQLIQLVGKGIHPRQDSPHAHMICRRPQTQEYYLCDLGTDRILIYDGKRETGRLSLRDIIRTPSGLGPRHLVFPGRDRMLALFELGNLLGDYAFENGAWVCRALVSTLPEGWHGESTAAAVRVESDRVYVSNRGHDSLACFAMGSSFLALEWIRPSGGAFPRDFVILPDGRFLIAHQKSGDVTLWTIRGGKQAHLAIPGAVCICRQKPYP